MSRAHRLLTLLLACALIVSACGGDDDAGSSTTADATASSTTSTSVAPETTTMVPTTTTAAATTTTTTAAPATTTSTAVSSAEADAVVAAKTAAAAEQTPAGWDSAIVFNEFGEASDDVVFGPCSGPDGFDLANLDATSLAVGELAVTGIFDGAFPAPQANVEARVFESEAVASDAFAVLETVLGTAEGRQCVADNLSEDLAAEVPPDADFEFELQDLDAAGADVGARIVINLGIQGLNVAFTIDLVASRDADCTVFASFFGFGAEFDPALRDAMMVAAIGA